MNHGETIRVVTAEQNRSDKYVRAARTALVTSLITSGKWMAGSVSDVMVQGQPYQESLFEILFFPCLLFILLAFITHGEFSPKSMQRRYLWLPALTLIVLPGETVTLLGLWNLNPILGWWRSAILLVAAATLTMWATERTAKSRQKTSRE